ncbi:hypothetical protein GPY61_30870 [Massilia sp. NEAU-DD11]|uniref:Uncharacterized protein n=1 Tax=Massilia cellulosiltytica TaxID=2683234 RepID=A0A7X3KBR5_9BURK|nr:hypothetical protein [Telluria cellulosilytica]MVW64336.1 hypothetical protein [Telluria cellulosilytica]
MVKARKLWETFGERLYQILDTADVEALVTVLTEDSARQVVAAWSLQGSTRALQWLQSSASVGFSEPECHEPSRSMGCTLKSLWFTDRVYFETPSHVFPHVRGNLEGYTCISYENAFKDRPAADEKLILLWHGVVDGTY